MYMCWVRSWALETSTSGADESHQWNLPISDMFFDKPVRTYSSGMLARLAFAVYSCIEPDILIVDEAINVGDAEFKKKCLVHVRALIGERHVLAAGITQPLDCSAVLRPGHRAGKRKPHL